MTTFRDRLTQWVTKAVRPRKKPTATSHHVAGLIGPYTGVPGQHGHNSAWQIQQYQGWVYTCVDLIATNIAACDPTAAQRNPADGKEEPLARDHPLARLLANPNDPDTGQQFWYLASVFYELTGDAYIYKQRDGAGRVAELWIIPSHWVRPVSTGERLVEYYEVSPYSRSGYAHENARVDVEDMIRVRKPSPFHPAGSTSAVQAAAAEIDTYSQVTAVRYLSLQNGAHIGGVLQAAPGSTELDDAKLNRIESRFLARYGGVFNFNRPLIVEPGWSYVPAPAGRELEYIQTHEQLRKHVITMFGLDEAYILSSESTYAAAIDNRRKMRMNVLEPRLRMWSSVLTEQLAVMEYGSDYAIIYPERPQKTHDELCREVQVIGSDLTLNERRAMFGYPPRPEPEADQVFIDPSRVPLAGFQDWPDEGDDAE